MTEIQVSTSEIASFANRLFPIARSLTGEGNRVTLSILKEICDLTVHEIRSGQEVFDWSVPQEWLVREAWIADPLGRKIVDFDVNALHLVGYSVATDREMSWEELEPHVYTHEFLPNAIPHRTSYYKKDWGFCVTQEQFVALSAESGRLRVRIDADHFDGSMSYGELVIPGESDRQLLISSYICHPYMANDCLSGFLIAALLARHIAQLPSRKWSYRFIFIPETVGAIAYSALHQEEIRKVSAALVITTAGGPGKFGLKKTWDEGHWLNGLIEDSLTSLSKDFVSSPFSIRGSDERQYSSPGLRINTATVSKDRYHEYPEYHTSLDDLELVTPEQLLETLEVYVDVIDRIEKSAFYRNLQPNGEPMLSKHGLYPTLGGSKVPKAGDTSDLDLMLWLLFYSDGKTPLSHIAKKLGVEDKAFDEPIRALMDSGLLGKD